MYQHFFRGKGKDDSLAGERRLSVLICEFVSCLSFEACKGF